MPSNLPVFIKVFSLPYVQYIAILGVVLLILAPEGTTMHLTAPKFQSKKQALKVKKDVPECISEHLKSQNFLGGGCPQIPLPGNGLSPFF